MGLNNAHLNIEMIDMVLAQPVLKYRLFSPWEGQV